jgi:hypothetical protein
MKVLRRAGRVWREKHVRVRAEVPDDVARAKSPGRILAESRVHPEARGKLLRWLRPETEWRRRALSRILDDPAHRRAVERAAGDLPCATIPYPRAFLDAVAKLVARPRPGAVVLITDFGCCETDSLAGEQECEPALYGDTLNHAVSFAAIEAFCVEARLAIERTRDAIQSMHTAAIAARRLSRRLAAAFRSSFDNDDNETLLDLRAALSAVPATDPKRLARFHRRCFELDRSPGTLLALARACLDAGLPTQAARALASAPRPVREAALELAPADTTLRQLAERGRRA